MKSRGLISLTVIALLSLLATCSLETGFRPASGTELPADQVLDVARSFSGPFTYETLLPVALNLTVQLYQQPSPAAALARQTSDSQLIVVSLRNSKGQTLYSGAVPSGGTLATVLSLPAAPQDVVLRLDAPGYEPREVTIDGMVLYSEVNRVMGLLSEGLSAKGELPDNDRDGVPDIYDVDPLDPEVAFQVRTPASGQFTVAFEDLYPVPGDADYNDFAAKYFILENHKSEIPAEETLEMMEEPSSKPIEVMLLNLCGEATATAKIAGYSHKFGIVVDFPGLVAPRVTREYYDAYGTRRIDTQDNVADRAVVWLYENTSKNVVGKTARFEICFPKGTTRDMVSIAPYDPVLYVLIKPPQEIHMVGQDPLGGTTAAQAAELSYMDSNGYPWALLVPEEWPHPAETQYIGNAYPLFEEWRKSKGAKAPYWYLYPASIGTVPGNNPPTKVSYVGSTEKEANSNSPQGDFQLSSTDPDGGVQYLSSPAPLALQDLFHLDADSGKVTFDPMVPVGDYLFYFWSMDKYGASNIAAATGVSFSFQSKTANNPPQVSFYDLQVGGAGTTAVNDYYRESGANEGWPLYDQVDVEGNYYLYYLTTTDFGARWVIHSSIFAPNTTGLASVTYHAMDLTGTWSRTVNGATPPPSVVRLAITGTLASGNVLTGTYNYSDAESDADASSYQWKSYASSTDTGAGKNCTGAGTTTLNYTVDGSDSGRYLRLEVTPRDARGAVGTPVLSGSVKIN